MQFISGIVVVRVDEYDMIVCGFFFPVFISFFFRSCLSSLGTNNNYPVKRQQ